MGSVVLLVENLLFSESYNFTPIFQVHICLNCVALKLFRESVKLWVSCYTLKTTIT